MAVSNSTDRFNGVLASKAIKVPCKVATSANITLNGAQTINGVPVVSGDRVLVAAQTNSIENGIYIVDSSEWQRAADWDGSRDVTQGTLISALDSGGNLSQYVLSTPDPITIGTTPVTIDLYSTGASGIVPPSTQESSLLRADALGGWQEESLVRATDTGELRVYEPAGTDFLQFDYVGTSLLATLDNPTHTIEFGNDIVIQGSDLILDSGDIILGGGTISGAGWLLPWETPIQWEDDTTPTPVITDFLVFAGFTPGGEPAPDPNLGNVTLLVTGETAAAGFTTTFSADIGGVGWTYGGGDPFSGAEVGYPTNANSKHGNFSIFVKGETGATFEGFVGPVQTSTEAAVFFPFDTDGLGEWTIEFWIDPSTEYTGLNPDGRWNNGYPVIAANNSQGNKFFYIEILTDGDLTMVLPNFAGTAGVSVYSQVANQKGNLPSDWMLEDWTHWAIWRESDGEIRCACDGILAGVTGTGLIPTQASTAFGQPTVGTETVNWGCNQRAGQVPNGQGCAAYVDDLRITAGVARYSQGAAAVGQSVLTPPGPLEGTAKVKQFVVGDPVYQVNLNAPSVLFDDGTNSATITPNSVGLTLGTAGMSAGQFAVQDGVGNSRIVWSNTAGDDSISAEADGARLHFKNQTGLFTSVRFGEDPFPVNVDVSGGDLIISGYVAGANEQKKLSFQDSGGVEYAYVETGGTGALTIANLSLDDSVSITGNDGGSQVTILDWNTASHLNLRAPGGRDLNLYVATNLAQKIDNLGEIDFYYLGGANIARVSSEAGGGFLVSQVATGETTTLSRVQTQYDLGGDQEFWFWDFSTGMSDPTLSRFRLNNVDPTLATAIAVDDLTISNRDFAGSLAAIQAGTQIKMVQTTDLALWAVYEATGPATDNTGWWQIPVTYVAHNGTFPGATRPPFKLTFSNLLSNPVEAGGGGTILSERFAYDSTTTSGDPGAGNFRISSPTPSAATAMYINDTGLDGTDVGLYLAQCAIGDIFAFASPDDPTNYNEYKVTSKTDNTGWWTVGINYVGGTNTLPAATTECRFEFRTDAKVDAGAFSGNSADIAIWDKATDEKWVGTGTAFRVNTNSPAADGRLVLGSMTGSTTINPFIKIEQGNSDNTVIFAQRLNNTQGYYQKANLNSTIDYRFGYRTASVDTDIVRLTPADEFNIMAGGTLIFTERAAARAPTAAQGELWVRNDAPNVLIYTDDAGTDWNLLDPGARSTVITAGWTTGGAGSLTIAANAPLFYTEQATDDTPAAGQGQVWVRNDTPNTLMFTDDAGTDYVIGGALGGGIGGSISDNQIAVGAATADEIEGNANLTWDSSTGELRSFSGLTSSIFRTGLDVNTNFNVEVGDNFTILELEDPSVDTSVANFNFNIASSSTGAHTYRFRDQGGDYVLFKTTDQIFVFAGRLETVSQTDHGASFSSGGCHWWSKSRSLGDDARFTAGDNSGMDFSLQNVITTCYTFDNSTTAADPGAGEFRLNNATPNLVTAIYVNDADDGVRDNTYQLANLQADDIIAIRQAHDPARYWIGRITSTTDNTGWWTLNVTHLASGTIFNLGQPCHIDVQWLSRVNNVGAGATTGSVLEWSGTAWVESTDLLLTANNPTFQSIANGDPTVPNNLDLELLFNSANNNYGQIGFNSGINFEWISRAHGGNMLIRGENASGTLVDGFEFDTDGPKVTIADSLFVPEQAAAQTDVAGEGQLWVRDTAPNTLMFTDDTGVDYPVAGVAAVQTKVKTAEETRTSTTTFTDDNHLSGFALEAGAYYRFEMLFSYQHYQTPDFKYQFQFSNTPQTESGFYYAQYNPENTLNAEQQFARPVLTSGAVINATDSFDIIIRIVGFFLANATTGGTLDFQWAQNTSDAQAITARKGSFMKVEKIG